MRSLFLLAAVLSVVESRTCDCAQISARAGNETHESESAEWFNDFLRNLYELKSDSIYQFLVETIDTQVPDVLPSFVNSVKLIQFDLKGIPAIDLITHSVTTVLCDDVKFKRYTVDFDILVENPGLLATFQTVLILGIHPQVTVQDLYINGILRVEFLMSSELKMPSIQNLKMTFLDRPQVDFGVELANIGFDQFGIEDMLHNLVEDALQEKLVYPGMFYMDMSGENTTTAMIDNNPKLHPAVLAANITVTPVNVTQPRTSLEGWVDFGEDLTRKVMFPAGLANHQFDIFLENFKYSQARVRVIERMALSGDITWFDLNVDIPTELRSGSLKRTHTTVYSDGRSSWNITVDIWTMLLPAIETATIDGVSTLIPSLYTQTNCSAGAGDNGVLYIALHGGANLTLGDGDMDPYVYVYLDGKEVGVTETAGAGENPRFNYEFETLLRSTGKRLTDHVIEFVVWDWDRWSSDDLVGKSRIGVDTTLRLNEEITVFKYGKDKGKLYVTVLFRPVPFF